MLNVWVSRACSVSSHMVVSATRVYLKRHLVTERLLICDDGISVSQWQADSYEVISAAKSLSELSCVQRDTAGSR
jgi:hypothetical protein